VLAGLTNDEGDQDDACQTCKTEMMVVAIMDVPFI
jgi:hypothetical protein